MGDASTHVETEAVAAERATTTAAAAPASLGPVGILALQRTIGNAAVSRLVAVSGDPPVPPAMTRASTAMIARFVDPDSAEYLRGYNDGRGNQAASPGPLVGDALENYTEGYRRGKSEAEGSKTSSPPVDKPAPVTPAPDETFNDGYLQNIYDANKPARRSQIAALKLLDTTVKGVWSQLDWSRLARNAAMRIFDPNIMNQGPLGTCGPATVLNFLGTNDPVAYASLVVEVYRDGTGRGSKINKTLRGKAPPPGIEQVDWMLMSAVQDIMNDWYDYYGSPEGQEAKREGATSGDQRWAYKKFADVSAAKTIDTPKHDDVLPAARRVNAVVRTQGVSVNMHVSADVLKNPASGPNQRNHVIRLLKPIAISENADDSKSSVEFDAFTWGQVYHWKGTVNQFIHMMWAFTIASVSKGVI